jgi:hypothetical protein
MEAIGSIGVLIIIVLVALAIVAFPTRLAAAALGAKHTGTFASLVALFVAGVLHSIGLAIPCIGSIAAFLLASLGFAWVLGTSFWRGAVIQVLSAVITVVLVVIMAAIFGVSLSAIIPGLH